ncbi:hypothetical protein GCM10009122_16350 [Fulvivirga kasyanovii]|uniref:Anti-sigma factor n=1 Tax=Fulvivirga kasyanovii TaxID=396812 RepID=A0ABW9RVM4_9BACT|nr:hypothetical protein [Fulvivirga kasyanovii]MTI28284.1 hypothetical protein [Fulvivirga kasyanovii]
MKDKLKESVDTRRADFDLYDADFDQMWNNIEGDLNKSRWNIRGMAGKVAAAILVLAMVSWGFISFKFNDVAEGVALHEISPELAETEYYYSQQVAEKLSIIKASNSGVDQEVMDNLMALDSAYQDLKKDLKDNADNEEVIAAMIANYRLKLNILEQILTEIKQHDQREQNSEVNI